MFMREHGGLSDAADADLLNQHAGLRGHSGVSSDMRALIAADWQSARRALDLFCDRARKYIGAYMTVLPGADALLFGGGVGEHAAALRAQIIAPLGFGGGRLDDAANAAAQGSEARISRADSDVAVWVIPMD